MLDDRCQTLRVLDGRFGIAHFSDAGEVPRVGDLVALIVGPDGHTAIWRDDSSAQATWTGLWSGDEAHDPEATGMLSAIVAPLAARELPVMAASTFHADLVFVPASRLDEVLIALTEAGHNVVR